MAEPDATRRRRRPLIEGVKMRCPRCEELFHINQYVALKLFAGYEDQTDPIYKCPRRLGGCGALFSPTDPAPTAAAPGPARAGG